VYDDSEKTKLIKILYNYSSISHTFSSLPIWNEFNEVYGPRYSNKLRHNIVDSIKEQTTALGENPTEVEECLRATGRLDENVIKIIPCMAEKAKFEYLSDYRGKDLYITGVGYDLYISTINETTNETSIVSEDCWIFVFNWGVKGENLGHIKIYVVAISDYTVLSYLTCG